MGRLEKKIALVMGAGSIAAGLGNGKATAIAFAREGARVVAVDRKLDAARETADMIAAEGGQCLAVAADVTESASVKSAVESCMRAHGRIDAGQHGADPQADRTARCYLSR